MVVERTERESAILAKLADDGRLSVSGLASDFGVSEVTIRRHDRGRHHRGADRPPPDRQARGADRHQLDAGVQQRPHQPRAEHHPRGRGVPARVGIPGWPLAERAIADFNTRIAFLGTDGFSPERGLTTRFVEGAQVATTMRERAEQTWLVADSSKFGQAGFVSFLPLNAITGIITDSGLPDDAVEALKEHTHVRIV